MGHVFSKRGTDRQRLALERNNSQRIVFVPLFLAGLSIFCIVFLQKAELFRLSDKLIIAMAFYAVISVAFSCFAIQLLKRKSKKSELWLFQMLYLIVNASFLTYISYAFLKGTGSLLLYVFTVSVCVCKESSRVVVAIVPSGFFVSAGQPGRKHMPHFLHFSGSCGPCW